jgi:hypothetical protein
MFETWHHMTMTGKWLAVLPGGVLGLLAWYLLDLRAHGFWQQGGGDDE